MNIVRKSGGFFCGVLNGLFGSGGGLIAVPLLEKTGLEARKSHATSVAVIFFLSVISAVMYAIDGNIDFSAAMSYIPFGVVGAVCGSMFLRKVPNSLLRRIFGVVILISAVRILLK